MTGHSISGHVVSNTQTEPKASVISGFTRTQKSYMGCETLQSYGSICEVILKIHFIYKARKSKLKFYVSQHKTLSHTLQPVIHNFDFFCVSFMSY